MGRDKIELGGLAAIFLLGGMTLVSELSDPKAFVADPQIANPRQYLRNASGCASEGLCSVKAEFAVCRPDPQNTRFYITTTGGTTPVPGGFLEQPKLLEYGSPVRKDGILVACSVQDGGGDLRVAVQHSDFSIEFPQYKPDV